MLRIILEDCDSPHEVKLAVKSLPSDLEAVYSRCLTRKRKNRRSSDTKLLIWVCAAPKPLDIDALRELLAMDMETGQVSIDKMPAGELLLQSGGGLVALDVDEQLVLPVHSTAPHGLSLQPAPLCSLHLAGIPCSLSRYITSRGSCLTTATYSIGLECCLGIAKCSIC